MLTNRRRFLQTGAGGVAVAALFPPAHLARIAERTPRLSDVDLFVFEETSLKAQRAAGRAASLGLRTHAIHDDITDVYLNNLRAKWRKAPIAVAGFTTRQSLFCLELLARYHELRLTYCEPGADLEALFRRVERSAPPLQGPGIEHDAQEMVLSGGQFAGSWRRLFDGRNAGSLRFTLRHGGCTAQR